MAGAPAGVWPGGAAGGGLVWVVAGAVAGVWPGGAAGGGLVWVVAGAVAGVWPGGAAGGGLVWAVAGALAASAWPGGGWAGAGERGGGLMGALVAAVGMAAGVFYLYTALVLRWPGLGPGPRVAARPVRARRWGADWLVQAGLGDVDTREFLLVTAALAALGVVGGLAVFGGSLPALVLGSCLGAAPLASYRVRRHQRRAAAQEAWPRLIEEIRILTSALGRSVPQALFEAGRRAPEGLQPAFAAAQREWLLSTDFERTVGVLKAGLADPTADAACETLLVAHEVGGTDLDRRLEALIEDRVIDVQGRKDARAKQAGVRFARRFVLLVPAGMAFVGLSIGNGRAAYATPWGQSMVVLGIVGIVVCWLWAGRLLKLPEEERVFYE